MSRSKKNTLPQKVVKVATSGMPAPVRKTLGSRVISALIVLAVPVLLLTGVISIDWENGRPSVSFNRRKAVELKDEAADKLDDLRDDRTVGGFKKPSFPDFGSEQDKPGFLSDALHGESASEKVVEQAEGLKGWFTDEVGQATSLEDQKSESKGPFSKLKERYERR